MRRAPAPCQTAFGVFDLDTIFALSTVAGRSGVAVIRLSGPRAGPALDALIGRDRPPARRATLATLRDPASQAPIDRGLVLWLPGPGSFTGEDMAELQLHGGPAVISAAIDALAGLTGLRPAEAGEFTRRAFDNDKLDLAEVEGLADLIAAETEAQRRQALRQMDGELSRIVAAWRDRLVAALAHMEAFIDFPDEDLPGEIKDRIKDNILCVSDEMRQHLDDNRRGQRVRDGLQIAIVGAPNVGKSSLLNALARRDVAIVSDLPGTTRDVIEVHLDLAGLPVTLLDTAGLRDLQDGTDGAVEREGMRRARQRAERADLRLLVVERPAWPPDERQFADLLDRDTLLIVNKMDLGPGLPPGPYHGRPVVPVSARSGDGLKGLLDRLTSEVTARLGAAGGAPSLTRARHRAALTDCRDFLARVPAAELPELAAEDLRMAVRALGRIAGRVDVEDLLDVIFRDFCIGK